MYVKQSCATHLGEHGEVELPARRHALLGEHEWRVGGGEGVLPVEVGSQSIPVL